MTFKDRTSEFNTLSQTIRSQAVPARPSAAKTRPNKSQFMVVASQIGRDIVDTSSKLHKLTTLAKKRSIFDDPSAEIEELTFIIKQDIQNINSQISALKALGKGNYSGKQAEAHNDTVIGYLNTKLATTTKDFKEILQVRTETLRTQQERKQRFTGAGAAAEQNFPAGMKPSSSDSVLYKHNNDLPESPARGGGDVAISMPTSSSSMMMIQQTSDYTSSRVSAVESIEKTIGELQGIFQQLASLVAEQGEMIERIDHNVDTTLSHVDRGHNALLANLAGVMSNRWLIVKIFLVLIVFIIVFVVLFV